MRTGLAEGVRRGGEMSFVRCAELLLAGRDDDAVELLGQLMPAAGAKVRNVLTDRPSREAQAEDIRLDLSRTSAGQPPRDLISCVLAAELGDVLAAIEASTLYEAADDWARAEQVLRDALGVTRDDERVYRVEGRLRLARLLEAHDLAAAGDEFRRCEEWEGSTEAAWEAAGWCMRNGRAEEGRYRWRVLAEAGLGRMRSEVAYLESEWKTYRNQWQESLTSVRCWEDAMRRQMLLGIIEGRPLETLKYLEGVSESYCWTPAIEDLLAHAQLVQALSSPTSGLVRRPVPAAADAGHAQVSGYALVEWLLTVLLPAVLDLAGDQGSAESFAQLGSVSTEGGAAAAHKAIEALSGSRSEARDLDDAVSWGHDDRFAVKTAPDVEYWVGAAEYAYTHLATELGIAGTSGRLLARTWLWVTMAITSPDCPSWVRLWDETSRAVSYSVGMVAGFVRRESSERRIELLDPRVVARALDEVIPTLRSSVGQVLVAK